MCDVEKIYKEEKREIYINLVRPWSQQKRGRLDVSWLTHTIYTNTTDDCTFACFLIVVIILWSRHLKFPQHTCISVSIRQDTATHKATIIPGHSRQEAAEMGLEWIRGWSLFRTNTSLPTVTRWLREVIQTRRGSLLDSLTDTNCGVRELQEEFYSRLSVRLSLMHCLWETM